MNIPAESWILVVVSFLLSLAPAYYFYRKAKKEPIACYSINSMNVIDLKDNYNIRERVTVNYANQPIPRLSASIINFWNGGNFVLEGNTLVQRDPLRICLNLGEVLEATIIANPNPQCNCSISFDRTNSPNTILIGFDFLNEHNGVSIHVLHTALISNVNVLGTLKGVRLEGEWDSAFAKIYYRLAQALNSGILILISWVMVLASIVATLIRRYFELSGEAVSFTGFLINAGGGTFVILMFGSMILNYLKEKAPHRIPDGLKKP